MRLASPLRPEILAERLKEAVDNPFAIFGRKSVIGTVNDRGAVLRKRTLARNSFQPVLRVRFLPDIKGAILEAKTGLHPAVIAFMVFWMGAVIIIGGSLFLAGIADLTREAQSEIPWPIALVGPPAMLAFGLLIFAVGRRMARGEDAFLVQFLTEVAQARPLDPAARPGGGTVT